MQKSVDSAQVYKGAKIRDVLDGALNDVANLELLQKILLDLALALYKNHLAIADDSSPAGIKLRDLELDFLAQILVQIALIAVGYKTCRDEDSGSLDLDRKASLENLCHRRFEHFLVLEGRLKLLVALLLEQSLV